VEDMIKDRSRNKMFDLYPKCNCQIRGHYRRKNKPTKKVIDRSGAKKDN
jgi:hypothetical protein